MHVATGANPWPMVTRCGPVSDVRRGGGSLAVRGVASAGVNVLVIFRSILHIRYKYNTLSWLCSIIQAPCPTKGAIYTFTPHFPF